MHLAVYIVGFFRGDPRCGWITLIMEGLRCSSLLLRQCFTIFPILLRLLAFHLLPTTNCLFANPLDSLHTLSLLIQLATLHDPVDNRSRIDF